MLREISASFALLTLLAGTVSAQVARFENFAEGSLGVAFTDPVSGIRFQDGTAPWGPTFISEYGSADPDRPLTSPGAILSAGGYVPGGGIGVPQNYGFTAVLPHTTRSLSFDVIYVNGGSAAGLDVLLYSQSGGLLDTISFSFGPGNFVERHIAIPDRPVADIAKFTIGNVRDLYSAYDNIAIPEPASLGMFALGALLMRRRP